MLLPLLLTFAVPATAAVLNKKARFRVGPSRLTELIAWVDEGTSVSVLEETSGWYKVALPDGREGYIWGEHLDQIETPALAATGGGERAGAPAATDAAGTVAQEDVPPLDVSGADGGVAAKADLDRLAAQIDQIAQNQRELRQSLEDSVFTGMRTPVDGSAIAGGAFLTIGGIIGWALARLTQRRRDRRSRLRL